MKQILYFFPLNPAERNTGSISRVLNLLKYFKSRQYNVDFISKQDWGNYTPQSIAAFEQSGLADNLWVLKRKPVKKNPVTYFFRYKLWHVLFERKLKLAKGSFPNHTTLHLRNQFDAILTKKKYDIIIISYAYWADLIKDNPHIGKSMTIIDTHDLLSSQHQSDPGFDPGVALADELRRLSHFRQIWTISAEETYFFRQFYKDKVRYIPMMMDDPGATLTPFDQRDFDLIYVATDNPHNLASAEWFFKTVYPLLPETLKFCVIGTIIGHIPENLGNITRVPFAPDLRAYYDRSRVSLCPMLTGTGVKVKVVEAMAHGLPVVCSEAGVDGMPDKSNNGCLVSNDPAEFAGHIMQLLGNRDLYEQQRNLGRECFKRNFDTQAVYKKIDHALNPSDD